MLGIFRREIKGLGGVKKTLYLLSYKGYFCEHGSAVVLVDRKSHSKNPKGIPATAIVRKKIPSFPEELYGYLKHEEATFLLPVEFLNNGRY